MGAPSIPELLIILVIFLPPIIGWIVHRRYKSYLLKNKKIVIENYLNKIKNGKNIFDSQYEKDIIKAFVNKDNEPYKALWYMNAFAKYNKGNKVSINWNWSWWAFFLPVLFLIYRKLYIHALGVFIILIVFSATVPVATIIVRILIGGFATYFVYKTYLSKKDKIESSKSDDNTRITKMRKMGGYNAFAIWLYIIIIVGILAAVAIPKLAATADEARGNNIHDQLVRVADAYNVKLPKKLDEYTRYDSISVESNTLIAHHTVLINSEDIDPAVATDSKKEMKSSGTAKFCASTLMKPYLDKGAKIEIVYTTNDGKLFLSYTVSKLECEGS